MWERVQRLYIAQRAAENPGMAGGLAGAGVGLGVGQQIGAALNPDAAAMQQQMLQQQLLMQQMMTRMAEQQAGGSPQGQAPAAANPQTKEEIQAFLDSLDVKLANGQITEATYKTLSKKWQERLKSMG
jgi:uncharacterized protein involved in exopolysaccharide biosynthesis